MFTLQDFAPALTWILGAITALIIRHIWVDIVTAAQETDTYSREDDQ